MCVDLKKIRHFSNIGLGTKFFILKFVVSFSVFKIFEEIDIENENIFYYYLSTYVQIYIFFLID